MFPLFRRRRSDSSPSSRCDSVLRGFLFGFSSDARVPLVIGMVVRICIRMDLWQVWVIGKVESVWEFLFMGSSF